MLVRGKRKNNNKYLLEGDEDLRVDQAKLRMQDLQHGRRLEDLPG